MNETPTIEWAGCYNDGWTGLITPEAFAHPAKYARGLIERIMRHGLEQGYWQKGDLLGDPFGGVALGGVVAAYHGLAWVGVELEGKFVTLGNENIDLHRQKLEALGSPIPRLLQGDSRNFAEIVKGAAGICTSPPWADSLSSGELTWEQAVQIAEKQNKTWRQGRDTAGIENQARNLMRKTGHNYGSTEGQLGAETGDSYWQAMRLVYAQCLEALKPGGIMAVVVKRYVKNKKIVELSDQTMQLLIHVGFEPVERVKAMLVKETTSAGLFGEIKTTKARKSFFRRLAESKGSPPIDWEDVLFVRKP